jgi:SAM-dependent methyltransferase
MKRPPNFNHLARVYRWMEMLTFGRALWRCRCTFLEEMQFSRAALFIGDGDGRFLARLLEENPEVFVDALDGSQDMLMALVRNAGIHSGRVSLHRGDARTWEPLKPPYDLIVTHFFVDCLTSDEVLDLAVRLRSAITPEARWIFSEFAIPAGWFGWLVARPLVTGLYLAFRVLTGLRVTRLPMHPRALSQAGFVLAKRRSSLAGLLVSEVWIPRPA